MSIARVTELTAASKVSWEDAAKKGIKRAAKTLRGITGLDAIRHTAKVENGKISEFRITMRVTFILDE